MALGYFEWNYLGIEYIQGNVQIVDGNYSCIPITATLDYIQNDEGVLPRIAVIGVSGLAGIVLGYKGK